MTRTDGPPVLHQSGAAGKQAASRTGRPPMSERRRQAVRLEISRAAVRLFASRGVAETSANDIADAVGMSTRTLWRYFSSKEECVRPLLAIGAEETAARLRAWHSDSPSIAMFGGEPDRQIREQLRQMIRLTRTEPGLRAVWLAVHNEAESAFAKALAERAGLAEDALTPRVQAAMINGALRVAAEEWAWSGDIDEPMSPALVETIRQALRAALSGLSA
ncbi:TetR family transcriptional regulator [Streptomyces sp. NPDC052052]|uniref:TetR/AcrR family transcriptional regulator n=1 Tax=Streptomyces sp. NPDC052052 TaxID=3154756 RepID=UPI003431A690